MSMPNQSKIKTLDYNRVMEHEDLKRQIIAELKPIMLEAVEGWLSNQKDTLLLSLVGMIEQEKWKHEHNVEDDAIEKAIEEIAETSEN